jgi:hypothetical protein
MALMLALLAGLACKPEAQEAGIDLSQVSYQEEDQVIVEGVLDYFASEQEARTADLMVMVASYFKGTPYVAHTLESDKEHLILNLRELDCTTFAENCLAISRTIRSDTPSFGQFAKELQQIRYRNGFLDGYASRLHYFCDWIHNNQQKKLIADVSGEVTLTPLNKEINFMSTHPDAYIRLKDNDSLVTILAEQEEEISSRDLFFIPESQIAELEKQLRDGDIVGICTNIDGLAISHVGILVRKSGRIHMIHASSKAEKVIVSEESLEDYLLDRNSATGIMLARPL